MNLQPINPPLPLVTISCSRCGVRTDSTSAVADLDAAPGTFLCHACQDPVTQGKVWSAVNEFFRTQRLSNPRMVADYRKAQGFKMPLRVQMENPDDPSWAGCQREQR